MKIIDSKYSWKAIPLGIENNAKEFFVVLYSIVYTHLITYCQHGLDFISFAILNVTFPHITIYVGLLYIIKPAQYFSFSNIH